jgi:hypothetical protein
MTWLASSGRMGCSLRQDHGVEHERPHRMLVRTESFSMTAMIGPGTVCNIDR